MKYIRSISLIYDSIFYLTMHFRRNHCTAEFKDYPQSHRMTELCEEMSVSIPAPPEILEPFFSFEWGGSSAISTFYMQHVDYLHETIDTFTNKLRQKSDMLYRDVASTLFEKYEADTGRRISCASAPGDVVEALERLDCPAERKLQAALLFGNFSYGVELLIETMLSVHAELERQYALHRDELSRAVEILESEEDLDILSDYVKCDISNTEDTFVSVSLLNPYIVYGPVRIGQSIFMMLGIMFQKSFSGAYAECVSEVTDFMVACGSELRMKMLQGLTENREMTLSEFSKYVGSQPTTVIRNLRILEDNHIICVSRREAQQIFYTANVNLLKQAKVNLDRFLDKLTEA